MRKTLTLIVAIIAMLAVAIPSLAAEPGKTSTSKKPIKLEISRDTNGGTVGRDRMPMIIDIAAYYNADTECIEVSYNGEQEGEVYLYWNGYVAGYSIELNAAFPISSAGLYKIEIHGQGWMAEGQIEI